VNSSNNTNPNSLKWYIDSNLIKGWTAFVYSLPKEGKEHDGWSLRHNNAVVADGATPLSEEWGNDLYYWVNTLSSFFAEHAKDLNKTLIEAWCESINFVNTIFTPIGYKRTMGASHVRLNKDNIEILTVGDTKVIIEMYDGTFIEIFDERLTKWEQRADASIDDGVINGTMAAWHNRMKIGQLDGYHVVSDEPEVGLQAIQSHVDASKVKSIIICTDGLWRLFEDHKHMFQHVDYTSPDDLKSRLMQNGSINDDLTFIRLDNKNYQP
jgi:serine/threonine protein phosphatase PrpC